MLQKNTYVNEIAAANIMAVVRDTPEETLKVAQACVAGGVKAIEISFTTPTALQAIDLVKEKIPEIIICAGTVLDATTARLAIMAGVKLVLSPEFNSEVAEICNLYQVPYAPGCNSVAEITRALKAGASFIKFFPDSALEGVKGIKTMVTPIPFIPILVSGGVNINNYSDFLEAGANCVSLGSVLNGNSEKITANAKTLVKILNDYREKDEK